MEVEKRWEAKGKVEAEKSGGPKAMGGPKGVVVQRKVRG